VVIIQWAAEAVIDILDHGHPMLFAAGQLAAPVAGQQTRPPLPVEDADHRVTALTPQDRN
jgi:hypothetical protein